MKNNELFVHNYSMLRGWIKENFGSERKYADFLGITPQALNNIFRKHKGFPNHHIMKTKNKCFLTAEQIDYFFFSVKFPDRNKENHCYESQKNCFGK